jgi:hypothetical protein
VSISASEHGTVTVRVDRTRSGRPGTGAHTLKPARRGVAQRDY